MSLCSSFGPLGRRKIISNDSGSIVITRDGQLIARHITVTSGEPFLELIHKDLLAAAEKSGDGAITTSMIVFHGLKNIEHRLSISYNRRTLIRLLRVSEVVWSVVSKFRDAIVSALVDGGIWTSILNERTRIVNIIQSAVVPSSNASVATDVVEILTNWLDLQDDTICEQSIISAKCQKILQNFNLLVHAAIGRTAPSARPFAFVAQKEILLKGRCRDHSALCSSSPEASVEFLCFLHLLPSPQALRPHTVALTTALDALALESIGLSAVKQLVKFLKPSDARATRVIFCCDSVGDEAVLTLAEHQLYLIDCIPPEYLTYLAKRANCAVHLSPEDLLLSTSTNHSVWGRFQRLERLILGTRNEIYFKLHGLESDSAERERGVPLQLILRGASSLSVGVHVSMLQRALKVVFHSLGGPTVSSFAPLAPSTASCCNPSREFNMSAVVVPGAGAGELVWSILWQQVAKSLSSHSAKFTAETSSGSLNFPHSVSLDASRRLEERLAPLVAFLSKRIAEKVRTVHPDALCECAPFCSILSDAYQQVPVQCLINASDVLPEMSEEHGKSRTGGTGAPPSVVQALHYWTEVTSSAGASAGRVGLVVDSDPLSDEICQFEDAAQRGVVTSVNHFWSGFVLLLNAIKLRLRVGEVIPVKKRQNLPPPAEETGEGEDVDAVVQSAW